MIWRDDSTGFKWYVMSGTVMSEFEGRRYVRHGDTLLLLDGNWYRTEREALGHVLYASDLAIGAIRLQQEKVREEIGRAAARLKEGGAE
jgi:hypothetical protein